MKLCRGNCVLLGAAMMAGTPVLVSAADPGAGAGEFSYGLSAGATHSDNAGRTDSGEESETSAQVGLFTAIQYGRERYSFALDSDLQFQTHDYGNYTNTVTGGVAASAQYELLHEHLVWVAEDNYGQALIESRNTVTPDNSQDFNVFATGPDIMLSLGARTAINLQGRWTTTTYEKSDYGSRRLSGSLAVERELGGRSSVSLGFSTDHVDYRSLPSTSNYDVRSVYLAWNAVGASTTLSASAGYSDLKDQYDSSGGAVIGLELVRRLTARSTLSLNAGRDFGDSADALQRDQSIGGVSTGDRPAIASADPQRSDYASLSWSHDGSRGGLNLSADWRREAHAQDADLDRKSVGGSLQLSRRISARLGLNLHGDYSTQDFSVGGTEFDEWGAGLGLSWSLTRTMSISAGWDRLGGKGDSALGPDTHKYIENRYTVSLSWSPER